MNLLDRFRRALLRTISDDEAIRRVIHETLADRENLIYISPLSIMVDQAGNLYWIEETKTYRLRAITEASLDERVNALWPRKPEIGDETIRPET